MTTKTTTENKAQTTKMRSIRKHSIQTKMLLQFLIITAFAATVLTTMLYRISRQHAFDTYGDIGVRYAGVAASMLDRDDIDLFLKEDGDETMEYRQLSDRLDQFVADSDEFVSYLYLYQIVLDENNQPKIRVIYDSDPVGNTFGDIFDPDDEYYESLRDPLADMNNHEVIGPTVSTGQWGWLMSVYQPVFDTTEEHSIYVGIDISMEQVMERMRVVTLRVFLISIFIFTLVLFTIYASVQYLVITPVKRLEAMMDDFNRNGQTRVEEENPIESGDEFENLYHAIKNTEEVIVFEKERQQGYLSTIKQLAYRDELTGVKNLTAYDEKIEALEEEIAEESAEFAVVMVDMNDLKAINDRFGHEKGDVAIKKMCNKICTIFKHSPVFRVGGDEFVVILENSDLKERDALLEELAGAAVIRDMATLQPWNHVALSFGVSFYDPKTDHNYKDVFNRADENMYQLKRELKEEQNA